MLTVEPGFEASIAYNRLLVSAPPLTSTPSCSELIAVSSSENR